MATSHQVMYFGHLYWEAAWSCTSKSPNDALEFSPRAWTCTPIRTSPTEYSRGTAP